MVYNILSSKHEMYKLLLSLTKLGEYHSSVNVLQYSIQYKSSSGHLCDHGDYLNNGRCDVSFLDPLGDQVVQRERTAAVDVRHELHHPIGDGEGPRPLSLVVTFQVHVAVGALYCFTFLLGVRIL